MNFVSRLMQVASPIVFCPTHLCHGVNKDHRRIASNCPNAINISVLIVKTCGLILLSDPYTFMKNKN